MASRWDTGLQNRRFQVRVLGAPLSESLPRLAKRLHTASYRATSFWSPPLLPREGSREIARCGSSHDRKPIARLGLVEADLTAPRAPVSLDDGRPLARFALVSLSMKAGHRRRLIASTSAVKQHLGHGPPRARRTAPSIRRNRLGTQAAAKATGATERRLPRLVRSRSDCSARPAVADVCG